MRVYDDERDEYRCERLMSEDLGLSSVTREKATQRDTYQADNPSIHHASSAITDIIPYTLNSEWSKRTILGLYLYRTPK